MHGIKDLYINAKMTPDNIVAWQYLIDYLEDNGIRYGIQPDFGTNKKYNGYYVGANVNSVKATATSGSTTASVTVDLKQIGYPESLSSKFYVVTDNSVTNKGYATCTMDESTGKATFTVTGLPSSGTKTVYFLPKVTNATLHVPNIFEKTEEFEKISNLMGKLNVGDNFRLVVDPVGNEVQYSNQAEGFIPYNETYKNGFAAWLGEKYETVSALNTAWMVSPNVSSFDEAAQLMPVCTNNGTTILVHLSTNAIYTYNSAKGCMWDDCILYREESLADYLNDTADTVKAVNNVPVIYKNVSYTNPFFVVSKTSGGHDGIGAESYGDLERIALKSAITNAMCRQSAKTMWNIVTEVNTEENMQTKKDSGVISYGNKKTMYEYFNALYAAGSKGVYDFVFNGTNELLKAYAYSEKPEMFSWLGEYAASLNSDTISKGSANEQIYALYPACNATWNWNGSSTAHNKRTAVIPEDDRNVYKHRMLSNGAYIVGTNSLDISADTIIINIKDAPLSKIYGKQIDNKLDYLLASGKTVMIMGQRKDLGQIPRIDQYYKNEFATTGSGRNVQIVNPPSGSILLASVNDKPYAFKYGNLFVIADDSWAENENESYFTNNKLATSDVALNRAYYTHNGTVYAMPKNGNNTVTFKFNNYKTNAVAGSVIININDSEEVIEVPISSISGTVKNSEVTANIVVNTKNISKVNYYLWNSITGMIPLIPKQ